MNILFVCSRNKWRSPTAEAIYKNRPDLNARSAGTEPTARIRLTAGLIRWADIVFVMEQKHRERILENFREESTGKPMVTLHIPDIYTFMEAELIDEIKAGVEPCL